VITNPPLEGGNITRNPPERTTNIQELTTNSTELTTNAPESTTTAASVSDPIPIYEKICIIAAIKKNFYSALGNKYCIDICQGKPMSACNLYICYCITEEKLKQCLQ
jgi:hypothetical protein